MYKIDDLIRNYRIKNRISQEAMAETLKIRRSTLADWERRKSFPTYENLKKVCEIIGVELSLVSPPPPNRRG